MRKIDIVTMLSQPVHLFILSCMFLMVLNISPQRYLVSFFRLAPRNVFILGGIINNILFQLYCLVNNR